MARPLRLEFPGALYHVTARGNARQAIVLDDRDRALFLVCLGEVVLRFGWICHAYCLSGVFLLNRVRAGVRYWWGDHTSEETEVTG